MYYKKNHFEVYSAIKELVKREWRFNKKFLTWFKRCDKPKTITETMEIGDFLVFDNESNWKIKKKIDFKFEYKHLESSF